MLDTLLGRKKSVMVTPEEALPGSDRPRYRVPERHEVLGTPIGEPYPVGTEVADFGLGCFWGAERKFWQVPGVVATAAGYEGGFTPNPTYEEVCTGRTGHAEVVRVVYDPAKVAYRDLLKTFWEAHNPTQGMRQGNDVGTQYRSAIYTHSEDQQREAEATKAAYQQELAKAGYGEVTTEVAPAGPFWYAENYHQQYLHKVPNGYCGLNGCPVSLPVPAGKVEVPVSG